jgi:hypothetical protein
MDSMRPTRARLPGQSIDARPASNFDAVKILSNDGDEIALNQHSSIKVGLEGMARGP